MRYLVKAKAFQSVDYLRISLAFSPRLDQFLSRLRLLIQLSQPEIQLLIIYYFIVQGHMVYWTNFLTKL